MGEAKILMRLWSGFWGIAAAGFFSPFPSLHQRELGGFICTCVTHCFYKSSSIVPASTQFTDMTLNFWVDNHYILFVCFLLKEAQHLLKSFLSVFNLLAKDSRSCNCNTALMTVWESFLFHCSLGEGRRLLHLLFLPCSVSCLFLRDCKLMWH